MLNYLFFFLVVWFGGERETRREVLEVVIVRDLARMGVSNRDQGLGKLN